MRLKDCRTDGRFFSILWKKEISLYKRSILYEAGKPQLIPGVQYRVFKKVYKMITKYVSIHVRLKGTKMKFLPESETSHFCHQKDIGQKMISVVRA